jgi:site-specific DNA recombinase
MHSRTKAFVYMRRSQDRDDRQVLSIEGQLKAVGRAVETHGIAPIYLPAEEQTASKVGRPVFNDMMDRIEAGEARYIVTWAANRLSRNYIDGGRLMQALHTGKLLSIVTPERVYHPTLQDMLMLHIELGMSKMYSDEISANVKRGYQAKYERANTRHMHPSATSTKPTITTRISLSTRTVDPNYGNYSCLPPAAITPLMNYTGMP